MIAEPDKNDVIELTPEEKKELAKKAKKEAAKAKKVEKKLLKALQEKEERLQQKRDEYNREVGFASKTYDDHAKDWEKMLVDVNQDSMRNEVEILTAEVTQLLDRKQNIIERLAAERLLAQKQAERSIAAHIDFFSYSKFTFQTFAKSLRDMYNSQVEIDLIEFRNQSLNHSSVACKRKNFFENLMLGSNDLFDANLWKSNLKFVQEKEDFVNTDIEHRETIRDNTQHNMERLFFQMKKIVETVRRTSMSKERLKKYTSFVTRHDEDVKRLTNTNIKLGESTLKINALMEERHRLEVLSMNDLIEMKKEKEYFMKCFALLRDRYELDMSNDRKLMRYLMEKTNAVTTTLKALERRGGLILSVTNVIRKLQTEKEKVLVLPEKAEHCKDESDNEKVDYNPHMESFWSNVSAVSAQNMELAAEKRSLELENQRLRETIKRYCNQESYKRAIETLKISKKPTVVLPTQEAAHMVQLKPFSRAK